MCFNAYSPKHDAQGAGVASQNQNKALVPPYPGPVLRKQGQSPRCLQACEPPPSGMCVNMVKAAEMQIKCHFSAS